MLGEPFFRAATNRVRYMVLRDVENLNQPAPALPSTVAAPRLEFRDATGSVINGCVIQPFARCPRVFLTGADLEGANLAGAKFCRTTMPDRSINDRDC